MAEVLIIDDATDASEPLARFLSLAGHHVTTIANGREAMMSVIQNPPDVVVLDLAMPEMDGPSFLSVIRSYLRLKSLPVVVLTGYSEGPMLEQARQLHASAILLKGKDGPREILRAVEQAVGLSDSSEPQPNGNGLFHSGANC